MAKIIKNNISYTSIPSSASMLPYDNHDSGLDATNVKDAIDEIADNEGTTVIANPTGSSTEDLTKLQVDETIYAIQSSGSNVSVTQIQTTGTKIATITVDSQDTDLYAPTSGGGSGTVTSVTVQATTPIQVDDSSAITTSGTRTISHATSGATAGSYGDSSSQTPGYSGTFKVPYVSVNATGHVTEISDHTVTIPAVPNLTNVGGVSISSPASGEVLKYNGTNWVNAAESTGSTVSVTQIQSTGTKIATITVDSVGTDIYAPTGGGASALNDLSDVTITSATTGQILQYDGTDWVNAAPSGGGHTILNDSGTSLTQRSDLQFKGAYSIDNSTDSITEVNVIRSMTKSEFDLLSSDEKVGIINVTDVTGNSENEFQPVIYSETEREIGVWTDGSPLYIRTFNLMTKSLSNGSWNTPILGTNGSGIVIRDFQGTFTVNGRLYADYIYYRASNEYFTAVLNADNSDLEIRPNVPSVTLTAGICTIQYTKSSDTPGSGTWTPQGVPAVHYLSNEHVVGTWIDGSTIYEQTVLSTVYASSSVTVIYDTTSIGWDKIIDLTAIMDIYVPNEDTHYVASLDGPANLYIGWEKKLYAKQSLASYQSGRTMNTYITIRYTKSSS